MHKGLSHHSHVFLLPFLSVLLLSSLLFFPSLFLPSFCAPFSFFFINYVFPSLFLCHYSSFELCLALSLLLSAYVIWAFNFPFEKMNLFVLRNDMLITSIIFMFVCLVFFPFLSSIFTVSFCSSYYFIYFILPSTYFLPRFIRLTFSLFLNFFFLLYCFTIVFLSLSSVALSLSLSHIQCISIF